MLLGLLRPDKGDVSLFGQAPASAIDKGAIGAMLQTGALIRDLSVRELVTMMAAPGSPRGSQPARLSACASRSRS